MKQSKIPGCDEVAGMYTNIDDRYVLNPVRKGENQVTMESKPAYATMVSNCIWWLDRAINKSDPDDTHIDLDKNTTEAMILTLKIVRQHMEQS